MEKAIVTVFAAFSLVLLSWIILGLRGGSILVGNVNFFDLLTAGCVAALMFLQVILPARYNGHWRSYSKVSKEWIWDGVFVPNKEEVLKDLDLLKSFLGMSTREEKIQLEIKRREKQNVRLQQAIQEASDTLNN